MEGQAKARKHRAIGLFDIYKSIINNNNNKRSRVKTKKEFG